MRVGVVLLSLVLSAACGTLSPRGPTPGRDTSAAGSSLTHGIASGEVTSHGAVVWARCDGDARMHVALRADGDDAERTASAPATADHDYTAKVVFDALEPDTAFRYRAWCAAGANAAAPPAPVEGRLRTAPVASEPRPVRFAWGGDLGGQNVCRDRVEGYTVFDVIAAQEPAFFIGLGDMIYADDPCLAIGRYGNPQVPGPPERAVDLAGFWSYWKYNRDDPHFQDFLATTPYWAVWDDHEMIDDAGPYHDAPVGSSAVHLLAPGLQAFLDYNPLLDAPASPKRVYRSARWGRHLELFLLDARQYRAPNFAADDAAQPKSMLGLQQRTWLEESLRRSDATWKVIVSSVPLAVPTGSAVHGRDGWANHDQPGGFERELLDLLRFIRRCGVRNTLWISTDIHHAAVFQHTPFADAPSYSFYELDTGPLNSGVYPKREYDRSLGARRRCPGAC